MRSDVPRQRAHLAVARQHFCEALGGRVVLEFEQRAAALLATLARPLPGAGLVRREERLWRERHLLAALRVHDAQGAHAATGAAVVADLFFDRAPHGLQGATCVACRAQHDIPERAVWWGICKLSSFGREKTAERVGSRDQNNTGPKHAVRTAGTQGTLPLTSRTSTGLPADHWRQKAARVASRSALGGPLVR